MTVFRSGVTDTVNPSMGRRRNVAANQALYARPSLAFPTTAGWLFPSPSNETCSSGDTRLSPVHGLLSDDTIVGYTTKAFNGNTIAGPFAASPPAPEHSLAVAFGLYSLDGDRFSLISGTFAAAKTLLSVASAYSNKTVYLEHPVQIGTQGRVFLGVSFAYTAADWTAFVLVGPDTLVNGASVKTTGMPTSFDIYDLTTFGSSRSYPSAIITSRAQVTTASGDTFTFF